MKHMLSGATILVLMAALVAGGCATTGGGASDDEQVAALLAQWKDAAVKADADALMATYSESFTHDGYEYDAEDKDALTEYIEYAIDEGNFDGVEIAMDSDGPDDEVHFRKEFDYLAHHDIETMCEKLLLVIDENEGSLHPRDDVTIVGIEMAPAQPASE